MEDCIAELMKNLSLIDFEIGAEYLVDVTHINNPHSFYIRPRAYRKYLSLFQVHGGLVDSTKLQVQSKIVFKHNLLNEYARGQIVFINNNEGKVTCDIHAPDYGCLEKCVPLEHIWIACHVINVPPLATYCQLADCKPLDEQWSERTIDAMKYYVANGDVTMIVREKTANALVVTLRNSSPDDIATIMALTGYSCLGYGENIINRLTVPNCEKLYFMYKEPNVDDVLHVRVQSGKSLKGFYVCQVNDYKHYLNERNNFTYFSQKQMQLNIEDLKTDKPIGVYMDHIGKFERAIIKETPVSERKVKVQLVDWGSIVEVDVCNIKNMSEKFFFYPAIAIYCSADDSQVWDNGLHKFLYPGYEFFITIKEVGEKFNSPNIVTMSPIK